MLLHLTLVAVFLGIAYTCPTGLQPCQCEEVVIFFKMGGSAPRLNVYCENVPVEHLRDVLTGVAKTKKLVVLTLKEIGLEKLPPDLLTGLRLLEFTANHCNLSTVDQRAFYGAGTLGVVNLDHNHLERVPTRSLQKLLYLDKLNLDYNRLGILHADSFKGIHPLSVLSLRGNRLKFIDDAAFDVGFKIVHLYLGQNELTAFPSRPLSRIRDTVSLWLQGNKISSLQPEEISSLKSGSLKLLFLHYNSIRHISPRTFSSLEKLETLGLTGNVIESIDPLAFEGIEDTLEILSVAENLLDEIPAASLRNMRRLEMLDLRGNFISTVRKGDFVPYGKSLRYLDLQNNSLTCVDPASLVSLDCLIQLNLSSNQLNTFPYDTYEPVLRNLRIFDIEGNPLYCDCEIAWLKDLKRNSSAIPSISQMKCAWPEDYADVDLEDVPKDSLICRNSTSRPLFQTCDSGNAEVFLSSSSQCSINDTFIVILQISFTYLWCLNAVFWYR